MALNQVVPQAVLQPQGFAGECVHVPQAHPLEKGGLVDADKLGQGQVEALAEFLPAWVGDGAQGDKAAGEIQLPAAVGGDKVIIGDSLLSIAFSESG